MTIKLHITLKTRRVEDQSNEINEPPHDKTNKMTYVPSKDIHRSINAMCLVQSKRHPKRITSTLRGCIAFILR